MSDSSRSGILVVEKGTGVTSFQVVAHLRRRLRASKVGHGGTLDPGATGVLPILIGEATKLAPYLMDHDKEYLATVRLGVITDTQDLTGTVLKTLSVPRLSPAQIEAVCSRFVGTIRQIPPMFSAIHHRGQRLYQFARRGVEVERKPREVTIHALALESVALPSFTIRVTCGKGTYVRALCADIGEGLGCGGTLDSLVRTRVGPFGLDRAVPWTEVKGAHQAERLWASLLPLDFGLGHWPEVRLREDQAAALLHGRAVIIPAAGPGSVGWLRLYASTGHFLGVGRVVGGGVVKPERIFHGDHQRHQGLPA
jgi:tRNA pseudouridine55 synthase